MELGEFKTWWVQAKDRHGEWYTIGHAAFAHLEAAQNYGETLRREYRIVCQTTTNQVIS